MGPFFNSFTSCLDMSLEDHGELTSLGNSTIPFHWGESFEGFPSATLESSTLTQLVWDVPSSRGTIPGRSAMLVLAAVRCGELAAGNRGRGEILQKRDYGEVGSDVGGQSTQKNRITSRPLGEPILEKVTDNPQPRKSTGWTRLSCQTRVVDSRECAITTEHCSRFKVYGLGVSGENPKKSGNMHNQAESHVWVSACFILNPSIPITRQGAAPWHHLNMTRAGRAVAHCGRIRPAR